MAQIEGAVDGWLDGGSGSQAVGGGRETGPVCEAPRYAVFSECPHCGGGMQPEHAHFRCTSCGWRDSCCD